MASHDSGNSAQLAVNTCRGRPTARRDARTLAELGRAGLLTVVQPPTPADEAVRDLARARDDAREDLQRCRHRLGTLLLRRGLHYAGRHWTQAHRRWVDSVTWTHPAEPAVVDDYQLAIDHTEAGHSISV